MITPQVARTAKDYVTNPLYAQILQTQQKKEEHTNSLSAIETDVLYEKYRPRVFKDMVGNPINVKALSQVDFTKDKLFIFYGNKGSGKNTSARILGRLALGLKENEDPQAFPDRYFETTNNEDISKEAIVEIYNNFKNAPATNAFGIPYRVLLIDEAQRMSVQAASSFFDAENAHRHPHLILIFTTTDIDALRKKAEALLTRCATYKFEPVSPDEIFKRLKYIASSENINLSDETLYFISENCDGSPRDAITKLSSVRNLTDEEARTQINGLNLSENFEDFSNHNKNIIFSLFTSADFDSSGNAIYCRFFTKNMYDFSNTIECKKTLDIWLHVSKAINSLNSSSANKYLDWLSIVGWLYSFLNIKENKKSNDISASAKKILENPKRAAKYIKLLRTLTTTNPKYQDNPLMTLSTILMEFIFG